LNGTWYASRGEGKQVKSFSIACLTVFLVAVFNGAMMSAYADSYVTGTIVQQCFTYKSVLCAPPPFVIGIPQVASFAYEHTEQGTSTVGSVTTSALSSINFNVTPAVLRISEDTRLTFRDVFPGFALQDDVASSTAKVTVDTLDSIHFSSSTLPVGTPVTFRFYTTLDSIVRGECNVNGNAYAAVTVSGYPVLSLLHDNCGHGSESMGASIMLTSTVGGTFTWNSRFDVESVSGWTYQSVLGLDSLETRHGINGPVDPDVDSFFFESLTPGVTFTSDSGASYALPTQAPEPSSMISLGIGTCLFVLLTIRRKKKSIRPA